MTDNDYIAEYVKEKHPEVLKGRGFFEWKLAKFVSEASREIAQIVVNCLNEDAKAAADEEGEDYDQY